MARSAWVRPLPTKIWDGAQALLQIVEMLRQPGSEGALHGMPVAALAEHQRLEQVVAEHAEGTWRRQLVVTALLQSAHSGLLCGVLADQGRALRILIFQVLADHTGVCEGQVAVAKCGNAPQRVELAVPVWLVEGRDDFQLIFQPLSSRQGAACTPPGQRCALDDKAHGNSSPQS
jgi:hypothetical protein